MNYHTRALRHVREHPTTETAQTIACSVIVCQFLCPSFCVGLHEIDTKSSTAATGCSMTLLLQSSRAAESSKRRRPGHLSAAYMCHRQTAIKVSPLVACPTAHPVQNSSHHAQGFVDFRSAIHRRTPTMPSDYAVSAVHQRSASLCAMDTH